MGEEINKMKETNLKRLLILMGLFSLLFFAGCESSSDANQNGYELASFNGGESGVDFSFAQESPPDKVRDQGLQPFSVRILVENNGEYDIPENSAYITLDGFNPEDLGLTETSKTLMALRGVKKQGTNIIPGGKSQVVFDNMKYVNSIISGTIPIKIYANICYPYETKSVGILCINGDTVPAIDSKAQICELEGDKQYANSGAPVKIENLKQYAYGKNSIQIMFDIVHIPTSSDANIYEPGSIDSNCNINGVSASSSDALFKRDRVKYTIDTGIPGLNCESTGTNTNIVTLTDNRYTVTCIQDTLNQAEYEKPISITLDYDYLDRKSKSINIEHIQT